LKQRKRRFKEVEFVNSEFLEALYENDSDGHSSERKAQRKAQQLCRQVQCALNLALVDALDGMSGLYVEEVSPAPDCGRLLVHVLIPADRSVADAIRALHVGTRRLRSEVAKAITRKRAPELVFTPSAYEGGANE
jgi:ribosome-binding factor A